MNSNPPAPNFSDLNKTKLPTHVAIIMDGNGRWAKKRLLNRIRGHEKGADTVRTIVRTCRQIGIRNLTLYAFSTENWQRPKSEIQALMTLLVKFLDSELKEMMDNNIRLNTIGEINRLPQTVQQTLLATKDATRKNDGMRLILALSYGSRAEIVRMAQALAQKASTGTIEPDAINTELVSQHLYTCDIPDPDLLIRTSGEMRISNFLLWQIAYTEIYVTDTLWPDFGKEEFLHILKDFQQRERRYGKVGE